MLQKYKILKQDNFTNNLKNKPELGKSDVSIIIVWASKFSFTLFTLRSHTRYWIINRLEQIGKSDNSTAKPTQPSHYKEN